MVGEALQDVLAGFVKKVRIGADRRGLDIKWSPVKNLHITLKFLGDTSEELIPSLVEKARDQIAKHKSFELELKDVGAFPSLEEGRVLWLGVQRKNALVELADSLGAELDRFVPHVTIGRMRSPHHVKDLLSPLARKSLGKVLISEVVLFESQIHGYFPVYTPLVRLALASDKTSLDA